MINSYSPGWYRLKSLAEGYTPPTGGVVNQTTLSSQVNYTGPGYLAGEFPGGTTTVEGAPVSATVRALYRPESGHPGDGAVVAEVQSTPAGTWRITGLNPDLRYDVVGRLEGRNDVIMAGVSPMRTDMITYQGELTPNEEFDGMVGSIFLLDGLPPFTMQGSSNVPPGLTPTIIDGRMLIIDGTATEGGEWNAQLAVQDSNSNTLSLSILIPVGFEAPSDLAASYDKDANEITLTWVSNSYVEEAFFVYRSANPIDPESLPPPIGSVGKGINEFADGTVVFEETYYYAVAAVRGANSRLSGMIQAYADDASFDTTIASLMPLSWWRLQEESGSTAVDEIGLQNGAYHSAPTLGAPPLRRGSTASVGFLNGSQQCYVGANPIYGGLFGAGKDATILFWYKHVASSGHNRLIHYFNSPVSGTTAWRMFTNTFQTPDNTVRLTFPAWMKDGEPHLVVIARGPEGYKFYLDGALENANPATAAGSPVSGGYGLCFPGAGGFSHYPARCYMSDIAIFDRELSALEVSTLYVLGAL